MDFALWKSAKGGEVQWPSPWGPGRPGWHIECSAMSWYCFTTLTISSIFGKTLDVHAGGIDLLFPHHDNEMNQCLAHYESDQWVNYFFHIGHLHIAGRKMSKSLKNFITIKDMLKEKDANLFRLFCANHHYRSNLEYSEDRMRDCSQIEAKFQNFFSAVEGHIRKNEKSDEKERKKWGAAEFKLFSR